MIKAENIFELIPESLDDEPVDILVENKSVRIERIISKGHASPATGWYDQQSDEWVMVLKGSAIIAFEDDDDISLEAGDHINIPAHTKHKVRWTPPETETVWLAVHYRKNK